MMTARTAMKSLVTKSGVFESDYHPTPRSFTLIQIVETQACGTGWTFLWSVRFSLDVFSMGFYRWMSLVLRKCMVILGIRMPKGTRLWPRNGHPLFLMRTLINPPHLAPILNVCCGKT